MKTNLVVCETNKGSSDKIREYCQTKGISTHLSSKLADIPPMLHGLVAPIILIELPDIPDKNEKVVQLLAGLPYLHSYPLVLLGKTAHELEGPLGNHFRMVAALRKPVSNADLYETVKYISTTFEFPPEISSGDDGRRDSGVSFTVKQDQAKQDSEKEAVPTPPAKETEKAAVYKPAPTIKPPTKTFELPDKIPAHELYNAFSSIPELFFKQLSKLEILEKDFNGAHYTTEISVERVSNKGYFPKNSKVLEVVDSSYQNLPKWALTRIHRVASLIHRIVSALCTDAVLLDNAHSAALLYNWVMAVEEKTLLRKDYLTSKSRIIRKDVGSRVKDSAMKIVLDLKLTTVGDIVSRVARLIAREEKSGDDDLSLIASTISAVDMVDRACWQQNHFNPRAAYKIMCMAKAGELAEFHPAVLCCIIKLLSEAIASSTQLLLVPKKMRKDPHLKEQAQKVRNQQIAPYEEKVEISDLAPGMKLSRPLSTYDGRQILEEDLILDQDLIWRIWQLSLVRPLNGPAVISRSTDSESAN